MAEPLTEPRITIRPATVHDTAEILELVNALATDQLMLPRSPASVIENVRDFVVAEVDGQFGGCAALSIIWSDIGEVRSIAVPETYRSLGLGRRLAEYLLEEAESLCERIAIIDRGHIVEVATKKALLNKLHQETFLLDVSRPVTEPRRLA